MSRWFLVSAVLIALVCFSPIADAGQMAPLRLVDLRFGTMIEDRQLQEEGTLFPHGVGRVYAWTLIEGAKEPTTITHVWYEGGEKVAEVPLAVRSSPYRTWSSKRIWPGAWKVEVVDAEGNFLGEKSFTVEQ